MINAFYSGTAGLKAQQTAVDNLSNNIANINTTGFKSKSTRFSEVLRTSMVQPENPAYEAQLSGTGVKEAAVENDMAGGTPQQTGGALDCCVNGDGFFAVQDGAGNTFYTRDGSFGVAAEQNGHYLETAQGKYVLDGQGARIRIGADGQPQANAGVFVFSNSAALENAGGNCFTQSAASGGAAASDEGYRTGYLEGSNVDLASQMTDLIISQRGYQLSARVVQTADDLATMINELKN